jgi:hypothetical protein
MSRAGEGVPRMPVCEKCKKAVEAVEDVEIQVCRQTHWSPAEYETQAWCWTCIEYGKFLSEENR